MIVNDCGFILHKKIINNGFVVKILSSENGVLCGFVKGKSSAFDEACYVNFNWYGRENTLGSFVFSNCINFCNINFSNKVKFKAAHCLVKILDMFFIESMVVDSVFFESIRSFLFDLPTYKDQDSVMNFCLVLKDVFNIIGYGMRLDSCKVSNVSENLTYLSPKSFCAISKSIGEPYDALLLKLPNVFRKCSQTVSMVYTKQDILESLLIVQCCFENAKKHTEDNQNEEISGYIESCLRFFIDNNK